jgi:hypothetical protein
MIPSESGHFPVSRRSQATATAKFVLTNRVIKGIKHGSAGHFLLYRLVFPDTFRIAGTGVSYGGQKSVSFYRGIKELSFPRCATALDWALIFGTI